MSSISSILPKKFVPTIDLRDEFETKAQNILPVLNRPPNDRQPRETELILNLLKKVEIIHKSFDYKAPEFKNLVDNLATAQFSEKSTVFKKGEEGDHFYIVLIGCCAVKPEAGPDENESTNKPEIFYHPGKGFGEISLIYDVPRGATVIAYQNTTLIKIQKDYFKKCLKAETKLAEMNTYFSEHPFLEMADAFLLRVFASGSTKTSFKEGDAIIREGEEINCLFFFIKGCATVSKRIRFRLKSNKIIEELVEIQHLSQNSIFGQEFMVSKKPSNLLVKAIDRGEYARVHLQQNIANGDTPFSRRILTHSKRSISEGEILETHRCNLYKQVRKIELLMGIYRQASQVNALKARLREAKIRYKEVEEAELVESEEVAIE